MLDGGLVSFSTLSSSTVQHLGNISAGGVIVLYHYSISDILTHAFSSDTNQLAVAPEGGLNLTEHTSHAICWRGHSRTLNVMCGKTGKTILNFDLNFTLFLNPNRNIFIEISTIKHQLMSLNVLRPKIAAQKYDISLALPVTQDSNGEIKPEEEMIESELGI